MSRRSGSAAKADNHSDISPFRIGEVVDRLVRMRERVGTPRCPDASSSSNNATQIGDRVVLAADARCGAIK